MTRNPNHSPAAETPNGPKSIAGMNTLVGYILLIGVLTSAILIITGTLWNWILTHSLTLEYPILGKNYFEFLLSSLQQLFAGDLQPHVFISLGIIVLMLTPYLRVGASVVYFAAAAHNWKYTIFTLFVFSVLTYSLFLR